KRLHHRAAQRTHQRLLSARQILFDQTRVSEIEANKKGRRRVAQGFAGEIEVRLKLSGAAGGYERKRQRAAALQDLRRLDAPSKTRQRLGECGCPLPLSFGGGRDLH